MSDQVDVRVYQHVSSMNDVASVKTDFLAECAEDYVGLWSIARRIRSTGISDDSQVVVSTLALLANLIGEGKIVAGQFEENQFRVWEMSPDDIVQKIKDDWQALGKDPSIGDIVWFTTADERPVK